MSEDASEYQAPERRYGDDHTRQIVKLAVHEIFDGVGVDFTTPEGRQQFRENLTFLNDARAGTAAARKTILGVALTGFAYGVWKVFMLLASMLPRP